MPACNDFVDVRAADLQIRALTPGDLSQVLDIEHQGYSFPWSEGVFKDCFRDNYRLWALDDGRRLVGYAIVAYMFDEAHLLNICVDPSVRRQGAGRFLLRYLLAEAARDGMIQVVLEVRASNDAAARLYLSEGFSQVGQRTDYYPSARGREAALVMTLGLGC
ncbi:ribosomal-protein-alanine N-acetyltransferase [Marinobacter salinexigens]|uniref:[Ribosomal protein bS18]-alanine N-acetyltransferase n=1 Tax=Marinobacter salinexigens TaxID=2919747 RepID=A0A5B0VFB9_9GAMM|nr:ribosomal protein S18-alanine N-acetyltransferase [Marinobacter salinexigens]KAA1173104.1 ribosomal-protein-alanine N-acetyltransferase [Marinobacter salinexigens]